MQINFNIVVVAGSRLYLINKEKLPYKGIRKNSSILGITIYYIMILFGVSASVVSA